MQYPEVEQAGDSGGITGSEVVSYRCSGEALPMHSEPEFIHCDRLWTALAEEDDPVRQPQRLRDLACRIMVSPYREDADTGIGKPGDTLNEEQTRVEIGPVSVVEVTGDGHRVDLLSQRQAHHVFEGAASSTASFLDRRAFVTVEASQRAVQVEVGAV
jgi:hypothetical protein